MDTIDEAGVGGWGVAGGTGGIPLGIDLGWNLGRGWGLKEMFEEEECD